MHNYVMTMKPPRNVAIIGASRKKTSVGHAIVKNMIDSGFEGEIYPINPKASEILGLQCYPSILKVPAETVDLAVIAVPAPIVPKVMEECGKKGVTFAVVISAGFKEVGEEGERLEKELRDVAKKYNIRVLGPNTLGFIDSHNKINASFAAQRPIKGHIAFASQSGAFCTAILDWSLTRGIGFSQFYSLGNKVEEVGIDECDLLLQWKDDPNTRVILMYLEEIRNGPRFIEIAKQVTPIKPVIVVKSGRTAAGARAISSHTGSLAGSDQAYTAAFKQSGVIRAETAQELFDLAAAFAMMPLPKGKNVAIITNAGGMGIMAADRVELQGLRMARFTNETIEKLRKVLPPTANVFNPVDVIGDAPPERYVNALKIVLVDPHVDSAVLILTPQAMTQPLVTARMICDVAQKIDKPVLAVFSGGESVEKAKEFLMSYSVPAYEFPERAVDTLAGMARHHDTILFLDKAEEYLHIRISELKRKRIKDIIETALSEGRTTLNEHEAKEILSIYGAPVSLGKLAKSADEAVKFANELGYPIVLKIVSPQIMHKTDIGGVKLNLQSEDDVRKAFNEIMVNARKYRPNATIHGILVTPMVPPGKEIIVGMVRDPQFGPLIMFGLGGIYVEVLKDVSFRVAPISKNQALSMIEEIRSYPLLRGVRGEKPSDILGIVALIQTVSQLALDWPEIVEMDINPAFVYEQGHGCMAIDVKMTLKKQT